MRIARVPEGLWGRARLLVAAGILAVLVWRLGTGPFVAGFRSVDGRALAAAVGIAALTSLCCAWRWQAVARGLRIDVPLGSAVAACYRSVFLNLVLPGGVVGDLHRGVRHGREVGDVSRAVRAVVWERTAGQVVQAVATVLVLLALPSPVRSAMPFVALGLGAAALALGAAALGLMLVARRAPRDAPPATRSGRLVRAVRRDVREALLPRRAWPGITLASAAVVAGHTATFVIAARAAGVDAPAAQLLPLAMLVLLAMVLPGIGGWGPREGAAAWAFGAAGLGAAQGVTTTVAYGVMVLVGALPGAGVLLVQGLAGRRSLTLLADAPERP